MGIVDEDVARVRETVDFVQLASQHVALKRSGRNWIGLCPFHAEKTPSFNINPELNRYMCFGCQAKGDVITFVREVEHLDFVQAVERLATMAGIELRYDDAAEGRDRSRRATLIEAMERAVDWYHERLLSGPDAGEARGYLRSRGYDGEMVRKFKIGWAPDAWDALSTGLKLPEDVLRDTGLGFKNSRGRLQDSFRRRVMFPIFDVSGKPVAFGGRRLGDARGPEDGPKYKNSPETPIYSKSRTLYGLNWAKTSVVEVGEIVVCEGYTDVIGFFVAGVERAVATCGTALTEEHVRVLKNFARKIVLAYDADAAGQAAAEKFYEWEQKYEIDVFVLQLPRGADPGDLASKDPDRLREAVGGAKRFLAFLLERAIGPTQALTSPEARARAAERAIAVVSQHPSQLVREQYLNEISVRTDIDPQLLLRNLRAGGGRRIEVAAPRRAVFRVGPETEALRLMVHRREEAEDRLAEALFADELHAAAYRALVETTSVHGAIEHADAGAAELLQRVAVEETEADLDDVVILLARERGHEALAALRKEAAESGDHAAYNPILNWLGNLLKTELHDDRDRAERVDAAGRLVAWLVEQSQESE